MVAARTNTPQELETLVEASSALRQAQSVDEMLRLVVDLATGALNARTAAVYLVDEPSGDLIARAWSPDQPQLIGRRQVRGVGIIGHVADTGEVHRSIDALTDPIAAIAPDEEPFLTLARSSLTAPLRTSQETVGVLNVGYGSAVELSDAREWLLSALGDMLGSALQQRLAHEQLERIVGQRTTELEQANASLLELDRLKDEFVSNVSHELRTPLTNIKLYLSLLQRGRAEKREQYLSVLTREADRLNALVDDLLDLSRLDMAHARGLPEPASVDVADVVSGVVEGMQARADEQGVDVSVRVDEGVMYVLGDRNQLTQVVANLLANAVAYTQSGGRVEIVLEPTDHEVRLVVSDTGIGIPERDRPRAFDRFYRGEQAKAIGVPGTGLGLAIVKEIVTLHGGQVHIDETAHAGTRMVVLLPTEQRPTEHRPGVAA